MLHNAETRAKALVSEAEARAAALLGDAESRLTQIRSERESVAGYIENLRGVLAQAESVAADHGFPTSPPDDTAEVATQQAGARRGRGRRGRKRLWSASTPTDAWQRGARSR